MNTTTNNTTMSAVEFATKFGDQMSPEMFAELAVLMGYTIPQQPQPVQVQPQQVDPLERVLELLSRVPQNLRDKMWASVGNKHIADIGRVCEKFLMTPMGRKMVIATLRSAWGEAMLVKAGINLDQLGEMIEGFLPMAEMAMEVLGVKTKETKVTCGVYKNGTSVPFAVDLRRGGWFKPILVQGTSRVDYLVDLPSIQTPVHAVVIDGNLPDLVVAAICIRKWSMGKTLRVTPAMTAFLTKVNAIETGMGYPTFYEYPQVEEATSAMIFNVTHGVELIMGLLEELEQAPQIGYQNILNQLANNKLGFGTVGNQSPVDKSQVAIGKLFNAFKGIGFK